MSMFSMGKYLHLYIYICIGKRCKKAKWLSEEALQTAVKRREGKSKGEKDRYSNLNVDSKK